MKRQMKNKPIGIFDSGLGGLTVLEEIARALPGEDIVYFGDTARLPYGTKSKSTIDRFSRQDARLLLKYRAKAIVVACNTASSLSANYLKRHLPVEVIGVIEPGVRAALRETKTGRIGVIATASTTASGAYPRAIARADRKAKVLAMACPLFVPIVEEGFRQSRISMDIIDYYLKGLRGRVDTLILGCTHYPLLKNLIAEYMGEKVRLIDSAREVAGALREYLASADLLKSPGRRAVKYQFLVSDDPEKFGRIGRLFLNRKTMKARRVEVDV